MATKHICDRCGKELTARDRNGGAHRINLRDVIPWAEEANHSSTVTLPEKWDACDDCARELRLFLTETIP